MQFWSINKLDNRRNCRRNHRRGRDFDSVATEVAAELDPKNMLLKTQSFGTIFLRCPMHATQSDTL
jgi:hypothetical protein